MLPTTRTALVGLCLAMGLCFLLSAQSASAGDPEVDELKARLERLEKQNALLLKLLVGKDDPPNTDSAPVHAPPPPASLDAPVPRPAESKLAPGSIVAPPEPPQPPDASPPSTQSGSVSSPELPKPPALPSVDDSTAGEREQIELLKKQNEMLKAVLSRSVQQTGAETLQPGKGQVEEIVRDYLKAQEDKRKADDEKKKKDEEENGYEVGKDMKLIPVWNHGLELQTHDKAFRVHVGGRTQFDGAWMATTKQVEENVGGIGLLDDAVNFRRARFTIDGTFYEVIDFAAEYDFLNTFDTLGTGTPRVSNVPVPTDLWVQLKHLPCIGNIRIGNQKPWISFEHMVSSRFLPFMERSLQFDAFIENGNNGFAPGVTVFDTALDDHMTWCVGVFKNSRSIFGWNVGDGEYEANGRVTCLPIYEMDGRCLVHLGLGASYRDADQDEMRYRARTLIRNGPAALHNIIAEARMFADNDRRVNPEFAMNLGPFTVQSEYIAVWTEDAVFPETPVLQRVNRGTAFYQGSYVELSCFLTGEHRPYNRTGHYPGAFGRVIPNENFFCVDGGRCYCCGLGAWQVLVRYSNLDLEDKGISGRSIFGAVIHDCTVGLNWFLNPNMKMQWNYSYAWRDAMMGFSDGPIHGFGMRMAMDF